MQLLSNVQMLHLGGEGTQQSASSSPNPSRRASDFSSLTEGHQQGWFGKGTSNLIQSYESVIHPNVGEVKSEYR